MPSVFLAGIRQEYSWYEWDRQKTPDSGALGWRIGPMYSRHEYPARHATCAWSHEDPASPPHDTRRDNTAITFR